MTRDKVFTVVSFESRMAEDTTNLIEKNGGHAISAPSMQEIPLERNDAVFRFADHLLNRRVDVLICLTGVGTSMMIEALLTRHSETDVLDALRRVAIVARGPKPVRALKKYALSATLKVPEPNTWRELLHAVDSSLDLDGRNVAVQEYGRSNEELLAGLAERGAQVTAVPVYRWALPDDVQPLMEGIRALIAGEADVAMFTSRTQVDHLFQVAEQNDLAEDLKKALRGRLIASIGPICSEGLREHGVHIDIEPEHPKLGFLIRAIAERAGAA